MNEKPIINVPIRENRDELTAIAKIAMKRLENENGILSAQHAPIITIAYRSIEAFIKRVAENKSETRPSSLNFFDIFTLGVTYEPSDDGEKDGNYNPSIELNEKVAKNVVDGVLLTRNIKNEEEEVILIEPSEGLKDIEKIRNDVETILEKEHFILTGNGSIATTVAVVMIEELWNWLIKNHVPGNDISINFCQLIEFGITYEDDVMQAFIAPGQEMKLITKNDSQTEEE
jgi:hypothetical protein